ncbi:MAG: hypothetical protein HKN13_12405 [Rhodothermales bacterium]|nr:hypothetical protein [Rhodothermales bacterium]
MAVKAFGPRASNIIDNPNSAGGAGSILIAADQREAGEITANTTAIEQMRTRNEFSGRMTARLGESD